MIKFRRIVLAACVACGVVGCEKFKTEPAQQPQQQQALSAEQKLALAEKCSKAGRIFFESYRSANIPDQFISDEPEFHYNSRLGTCLLRSRFVFLGESSTYHQNAVIDIFANKVLLQGFFHRDKKSQEEKLSDTDDNVPNFASEGFFPRAESLMTE